MTKNPKINTKARAFRVKSPDFKTAIKVILFKVYEGYVSVKGVLPPSPKPQGAVNFPQARHITDTGCRPTLLAGQKSTLYEVFV